MPVITSPLSPLPPMAHTYSLASHQNGSLSVFKSFSKERVGVRSCESLPPLRGGQGEYIPPPSSPAQSASALWKTTISCRKITQNPSNSIKNLPLSKEVAAGQGIPTRSRMHVLCPQIRKNCEYQRKITAITIHFSVGKIRNNSDQKKQAKTLQFNLNSMQAPCNFRRLTTHTFH